MSAANEYYKSIAALHEISLPAILSGRQISVADPQLRLPIHDIAPERLADRMSALEQNCQQRFDQAAGFLRSVIAADYPDVPFDTAADVPPPPIVPRLFMGLVPRSMITGHLFDFRLQAVTQNRLPDGVVESLDENSSRGELFYGMAHLLATAELYSGRKLGRVGRIARLAVVGSHDPDRHLRSINPRPSITSQPISDNDRRIMNEMRKSRGRAWWAERREVMNPLRGGSASNR